MKHINFQSDKSGFGVTSSALLVAYGLSKMGKTLLSTIDYEDAIALSAVLESETGITAVNESLNLSKYGSRTNDETQYDYIVTETDRFVIDAMNICVVENHYLTLKRAVRSMSNPTNLLVIVDDMGVLSLADTVSVMRPTNTFLTKRNDNVARAFDAGILDRAYKANETQVLVSQILEYHPEAVPAN